MTSKENLAKMERSASTIEPNMTIPLKDQIKSANLIVENKKKLTKTEKTLKELLKENADK